MSAPTKVESYFSGVADTYQAASKSRLWRLVREREARAVTLALGAVADRDVLELGCGAGYYTRLLLEQGARHVHAVDLSQRMLDQLPKGRVTPILGDAGTVDPGRRFSLLLSAGMLEFVPDPRAALTNAARFAEPGATLAILYPTDTLLGRAYRRFHRRNGLAISLFSPQAIHGLAAASGWKVAATHRAGPYSAVSRLTRSEVG